jgi:cell division septation protein DedD
MTEDSALNEKGLSTRHLFLVFLAGVAVCAVFFSLGFLVGYNEKTTRAASVSMTTEGVSTPATIPPTVNAPLQTTDLGPSSPAVPPPTANPSPSGQASASAPASQDSSRAPASEPAPAAAPPKPSPAPAKSNPEPAAPPTPPPPSGLLSGGFAVQVVASPSRQDAEKIVKILESRGYAVFLVTPQFAHAKDNLYRVQVGPFTHREQADKMRAKLAKEGFKPFVRH